MTETIDALREALRVAQSIRDVTEIKDVSLPSRTSAPSTSFTDVAQLSLPNPLAPQLSSLGLPSETVDRMSATYMRMAEELKNTTENIIRTAYLKLISIPRLAGSMPLEDIQQQVFDSHRRNYENTLCNWAKEATDMVAKRIHTPTSNTLIPNGDDKLRKSSAKTSKRQFKSEYLPLFEFAFEKDRFPSREDKKHLARISSMSYRQVCVWFQNHRCREASRLKSHRLTSAPKTFEELKERLGPSAREALSQLFPSMKKLNSDTADCATIEEPVMTQDTPKLPPSVPEVIVLDDAPSPKSGARPVSLEATHQGMSSPASSGRATSLEATDDGYESEGCDEPVDDDFLKIPVYELPVLDEEPTPSPQNLHPLNPFKTPVHAFPAVYEPSQLTSDPFVVEHHPWLRDPRTQSRKFIDPTPEAMEDIMGGFDRMDVDEAEAKTTNDQRFRRSILRNVSSGSIGMWSSGESTTGSQVSSSAQSSPRISEVDLPIRNEGTVEAELDSLSAEYTTSLETEDASETDGDTEAETVCDMPGEEEGMMAGSSAALLKSQNMPTWASSTEEGAVDAWALEAMALHAKSPTATLKWQNLLAVAAHATL